MSDKKKQFKDLIRRCEEVGWKVRSTRKNHTLIIAHTGEPYSIPGTSHGYGTAYKNALAWAERQGLSELERKKEKVKQ